MSDSTRRQHFVPRVYQKGWAPGRWQTQGYDSDCVIWAHDLKNRKAFPTGPNGILAANWFYEKDPDDPDNELEKWFQNYEGDYSKSISFLDFVFSTAIKIAQERNVSLPEHLGRTVQSCLSALPKHLEVLKTFAAVSYARTPAVMELKRRELLRSPESAHLSEALSKPHTFVSMARDSSLMDRFQDLHAQLWVSPEDAFVTSDRPCFDIDASDSDFGPLIGYDIGRSASVLALFPLSPNLVLMLAPQNLEVRGQQVGQMPLSTRVVADHGTRALNDVIINMADRWVISQRNCPSIFDRRTVRTNPST